MHLEPRAVCEAGATGAPPMFRRTVEMLQSVPEVAPMLLEPSNRPAEGLLPRRAATDAEAQAKIRLRIKMRLSPKGKFIHRNRFARRGMSCVLSGQQYWLFIDASDASPPEH